MNLTSPRKLAGLATLAAVFAAMAASASADPGPVEGAAGGCALQCIEKALVTPTASSAKIEIATAVPTRVVVTVRRFAAAQPVAVRQGRFLRRSRVLGLSGLEPERTYRITVAATDATGHTASRSGTFRTRAVQTTGQSGAGGLSSGLGCSAKCITQAVPVQIGPTAALFEVKTNTPAKITVIASLAGTGTIASIGTSQRTQLYRFAASPLTPGTKYDLRIRATDANGHTELRQFAFTTVERKAQVTFWKVQVIDDGDAGAARGELSFTYYLGNTELRTDGFAKRSSGDVFDVHATGSSRPGLTGVLPANGASPTLDIRVLAEECDSLIMSNCVNEVQMLPVSGGSDSFAVAGGPFGLSSLISPGALPGNYGTLLPSGHHAYLVFETTHYNVKFRVFATVDWFYAW
jgi:hypothetical protein